jgi:YVTN family beta-propeller protein
MRNLYSFFLTAVYGLLFALFLCPGAPAQEMPAGYGQVSKYVGLPGFVANTRTQATPLATGKVYVTSWFDAAISVIDLSQGRVTTTIPVGVQDHNVFLSPDKKFAWVTNNNDGTVSVVDMAADRVIKTLRTGNGPRHTFISPEGKEAYVTNEFDDSVAVIDPAAYQILGTVKVGSMPHFPIVVGDKLFVTNFGSGDVTVILRPTREVIATLPVGLGPLGAGMTRDGKRVYVACHNSNHVAVIDVETLRVIARVQTEPGPVQITVAPDQKHAYVAADGRGTVQKIDLATNQVVKTIGIGRAAGTHGITFAGGGTLLLVTNTGAGTVSVIDTQRDDVLKEINVGTAPEGIAFRQP